MSEKAKGKWKVTETDDEGAENEEKTDGGRKRRQVTVRDLEETDWVWRMTEFMGQMEEWVISPQSTYFCVLIHAQHAHPTLTPTLAVQSGN